MTVLSFDAVQNVSFAEWYRGTLLRCRGKRVVVQYTYAVGGKSGAAPTTVLYS